MAERAVTFDSESLDANTVQLADASSLFQNEVETLRENQKSTPLVELSPRQGEGIWALAREAYRLTGEDEPTPTQVKALAQDIARRNELPIDATLSSNQKLMVKLPGAIEKPANQKSTQAKSPDSPKCSSTWEEVNMIANWVTKNEAGHKSYIAFNPDDNGAGISVGLMQWNQERGLLPDLVEEWHDRNPAKFNQIFGSNATKMLNESWLRSVDFSSSPALTEDMKEALELPEFQRVQLNLRNEHIEESCEMAKGYGFSSLRGRAVIADLVNQLGKGGTRRFLSKIPFSGNESNRIEQLKAVTDDRVNAADRIAIIEQEVKKIWRQQAEVQK